MNLTKLNERIAQSGLKKVHIAQELGITVQGLSKKLSGKSEFKINEIEVLKELLNEKTYDIFFEK